MFYMNDKPHSHRCFRGISLMAGVAALALSAPASAGETVLYADAPGWIDEAMLVPQAKGDSPSMLIADWQYRLEDGVVTSYFDRAVRIDNPELAMENGTISLTWYPDKGDLTVHRAQIVRGGETIELTGDDLKFEVLRRETGLERRLLDGELTATLSVPGLQVGDVLRVTHSTTLSDQALGEEMQVLQMLPAKPWQVGMARAIVSWPTQEEMFWRAEDAVELPEPVEAGGYRKLVVQLPLEEAAEMPHDAPLRYRRAPVLRVGTFADWQELSRVMHPHFAEAAQVAADSDVAAQARAIMARSDDTLTRVALAVRLVQDEVSYLLDGLDGGNYLPQSAEETWQKRYGDCKAKSVLLLSLLAQMGIPAEAVLVHSSLGDAVPELLPLPGDFDHVIVHARIDGTDYWLDGTSTATRLSNLAEVPPFYHALPLRAEGAELVPMIQRDKPWPDGEVRMVSDYSAGVDLPAPFELTLTMYGPRSAQMRKMVDESDLDARRKMAQAFGQRGDSEGMAISSIDFAYDDEAAAGTIVIRGISGSEFIWDNGRLVLDPSLMPGAELSANRAKAEWRSIPVATRGPMRNRSVRQVLLPSSAEGFVYEGFDAIEESFGNTRFTGSAGIDEGTFTGKMETVMNLGEIAPQLLGAAKRDARRIESIQTRVVAPEDLVWRWEVPERELAKRVEPLLEVYGKAIDFAVKDDFGPLSARAVVLMQVYQWEKALADLDLLVEKDTSSLWLAQRSGVLEALGRTDEAIADLERAYDLEPDIYTATSLAMLMAYNGRTGDGLALLDEVPASDDELGTLANAQSIVLGLDGRVDEAVAVLAEATAQKPQDPDVLNSDCWFRGLFATALDDALAVCTKAIELSENGAHILDSRAMVHYRRGELAAAQADLDRALALNPALAPSLFMRGIVRLEQGDSGGRKDIDTAMRMMPHIGPTYAAHGIEPPR